MMIAYSPFDALEAVKMTTINSCSNGNDARLIAFMYPWVSARKINSIANALELCLSCTNPSI